MSASLARCCNWFLFYEIFMKVHPCLVEIATTRVSHKDNRTREFIGLVLSIEKQVQSSKSTISYFLALAFHFFCVARKTLTALYTAHRYIEKKVPKGVRMLWYFGFLVSFAFAVEFQYLSAPWTPFNEDQSVNYEAIACSHALHAKNGVTFAWVAGEYTSSSLSSFAFFLYLFTFCKHFCFLWYFLCSAGHLSPLSFILHLPFIPSSFADHSPGNFGQWTSLTDTERLTIFEHWVQANRASTKKINLIAHMGSNSLQSACELARQTTLRFGKGMKRMKG